MKVRRGWRSGRRNGHCCVEEGFTASESVLVALESDKMKGLSCGGVLELKSDGEVVRYEVRQITKYKDFEDLFRKEGVENFMPGYSLEQAIEAMKGVYPDYTGNEAVYALRVIQLD